jgi:signal transduction histidine kinase
MDDRDDVKILELNARVGTLEQLLDVYERSVIDQSDRLYAEQERIRFQKTLLECQGEAELDGLLSVGVDGVVVFANRRFSELWGVAAPTIGKSSHPQLFRSMAEQTVDPAGFLERSASLESSEQCREEIFLRDGRTLDQYTAPIRSQEGRHFGRVWHFSDISAFKEIGRLKDEFISAVSHELRTPLTSVRGSLDLMASGVLGEIPSEAMTLLKVAQNNCDRLVRFINDVLDIEKIEAGRMDFHLAVRELEPLLEQSVETIRPYGDQLGVDFRFENSAPGVRARVDSDRLIQVMENLLSNAAKFSPPGGTVQIALASSGRYVRVSVTDQGQGIAPEFRSRLFERFAQGVPAASRQKGGTGLGLTIARAIVERLGGTIGFVSRTGEGTTFHFDLPAWRAGKDGGPPP